MTARTRDRQLKGGLLCCHRSPMHAMRVLTCRVSGLFESSFTGSTGDPSLPETASGRVATPMVFDPKLSPPRKIIHNNPCASPQFSHTRPSKTDRAPVRGCTPLGRLRFGTASRSFSRRVVGRLTNAVDLKLEGPPPRDRTRRSFHGHSAKVLVRNLVFPCRGTNEAGVMYDTKFPKIGPQTSIQ